MDEMISSSDLATPDGHIAQTLYTRTLLVDTLHSIGLSYLFFILATALLGLTVLLPAQFLHFFTESTQQLSSLNAQIFLAKLFGFGALVALSLFISFIISTLIHESLRLKVETSLREKVLSQVHKTPLSYIDSSQRGDWLTRITTDLSRTEMFLTESLPDQLRQLTLMLGTGVLFFTHTGLLALLPLSSALIIASFHFWIQKSLSPALAQLRGLHASVFQMLIESFEGTRTIRTHHAEFYISRQFQNKLSQITTQSMKVVRFLGGVIGGSEFIGQILITLCLSWVALVMTKKEITLEQALIYPFFIGIFYGAVQKVASGAYEWNRFLIEGGRLGAFLYSDLLKKNEESKYDLGTIPYQIDLSQIQVGHAPSIPVTKELSFKVAQKECLAIIGPSGVGKSLLLETLAGLRPGVSGRVSFVDRNQRIFWQDEGTWCLPSHLFSFVEQRPYIFEGSLRENLTLGQPHPLADLILWNTIERVGLLSFAKARDGLEHKFLDRGRNLSEGERYRIALCRSLLLQRPFILLDEPFATLDKVSMEIVVSALNMEREKSGIILVTHFLPKNLKFDALVDFTNYQFQRRNPSLMVPELQSTVENHPFFGSLVNISAVSNPKQM